MQFGLLARVIEEVVHEVASKVAEQDAAKPEQAPRGPTLYNSISGSQPDKTFKRLLLKTQSILIILYSRQIQVKPPVGCTRERCRFPFLVVHRPYAVKIASHVGQPHTTVHPDPRPLGVWGERTRPPSFLPLPRIEKWHSRNVFQEKSQSNYPKSLPQTSPNISTRQLSTHKKER